MYGMVGIRWELLIGQAKLFQGSANGQVVGQDYEQALEPTETIWPYTVRINNN